MIKYVQPVKPSSAEGLVAEVYAQVKRDFGLGAEPFQIHSPVPKLLAGLWMVCRETELVGSVPRPIKEVVAAAVSQLNQCLYCVDAHTIMLSALKENSTSTAIRKVQIESISDPKTRMVAEWALATNSPSSDLLRWLPFSRQEAPEIIGTAIFYQYINRMANVLLGETPLPSNNRLLKGSLTRIASWMFLRAVNRPKIAGESFLFLPEADLPNDLRWAKANPNVARAYASFAATVEEIETKHYQ